VSTNGKYYLIRCSADGVYIEEFHTKESLLEDLLEPEEMPELETRFPVAETAPFRSLNLNEFSGAFILKGEIVAPQPKEMVTAWEID
jgi:hypothetical protein